MYVVFDNIISTDEEEIFIGERPRFLCAVDGFGGEWPRSKTSEIHTD